MSTRRERQVAAVAVTVAVAATTIASVKLLSVMEPVLRTRWARVRGWWDLRISCYLAGQNNVDVVEAERLKELRGTFQQTPSESVKPLRNHTHGFAAAGRQVFHDVAERVGANSGYTLHYTQRGTSDVRAGRAGSMRMYWLKDAAVPPAVSTYSKTQLEVFVDSDFYVDMPSHLATTVGPRLLYTINPTAAARSSNEISYTFDSQNRIDMLVRGGGRFCHELWDYNTDSIVCCLADWIGLSVAVYTIDRIQIAQDREAVLLTPVAHWTGLAAILSTTLTGNALKRLDVVDRGFVRMRVQTPEGLQVSTAVVGEFSSVTVPEAVDNAILNLPSAVGKNLQLATIQSYLHGDEAKTETHIYHRYLAAESRKSLATVVPVSDAVRRYQFYPGVYNQLAKAAIKAFGQPVVDSCYAADCCSANEVASVAKRIVGVANDVQASPAMANFFRELAALLFPREHEAVPVTLDEVWERQCSQAQRNLLRRANVSGPNVSSTRSSFMKRQAEGKPTDPRVITTIPPTEKLEYSSYTYVASKLLASTKFYASSCPPLDVARRVAEVCANADSVAITDFARMDGRISPAVRELETVVMLRIFRVEHHAALRLVMSKQYGQKTYGRFEGTSYRPGTARQSGSPETSLLNTIANIAVGYITMRCGGHSSGIKLPPARALAALGVYLGDDGLTADVKPEVYASVAKSLGMELTVDVVARGAFGVNFLNRFYTSEVWTGRLDSMSDPKRALSKFFTTVNLPENVSAEAKLIEKAISAFLSDGNSPGLGDIARTVMRLAGFSAEDVDPLDDHLGVRSYSTKHPVELQYPNDMTGVGRAMLHELFPEFNLPLLVDALSQCRCLADVLTLPLCAAPPSREPVPSSDCVVAGVVVAGEVAERDPPSNLNVLPGPEPANVQAPSRGPSAARGRGGGAQRGAASGGAGRGRGRGASRGRGGGSRGASHARL